MIHSKKHLLPNRRTIRRLLFIVLLSVPIFLFCLPLLQTGGLLMGGDADYMMQTQEALRKSLFEYRQFPWWNPWVSGGVPLFANPNFGLISIQSLTSVIFEAAFSYKFAIFIYYLVGFWGFYLLFTKAIKTPRTTAILLAYVWTFGSFLVQRSGGHYTFYTIQFFPWVLYIFLCRKYIKLPWFWLGLILGLMANTAAHTITFICFFILALLALLQIARLVVNKIRNNTLTVHIQINTLDVLFWVKTFGIFIVLAGYRLYYSLQYIHEFPRTLSIVEASIGVPKALYAIFGPFKQFVGSPSIPLWSWMEASAYIGLATGVALIVCLYALYKQRGVKKMDYAVRPITIVVLGCAFFALGLGSIVGSISPYSILKHLPVFSDMRVATRWLVWCSVMVLILISLYRGNKFRTLINALLLVSVVEMFIINRPFLARPYIIKSAQYESNLIINQQVSFDTQRYGIPYDENLTATTRSNMGQIIAGDSLIDTRWAPPFGITTVRCDSDAFDCKFVLTNNAGVEYWSPNKIKLVRTGEGPIRLNMNPGNYWLVNDIYIFRDMRVSEPGKDFLINDTSKTIELRIMPRFSVEWVVWKLNKIF